MTHFWFADMDANVLALGAIVIILVLLRELIRERRKHRRLNHDHAARVRSGKGHWGYS